MGALAVLVVVLAAGAFTVLAAGALAAVLAAVLAAGAFTVLVTVLAVALVVAVLVAIVISLLASGQYVMCDAGYGMYDHAP